MSREIFEEKYGMTKKEAKRLDRESLVWEKRFERAELKRHRAREQRSKDVLFF